MDSVTPRFGDVVTTHRRRLPHWRSEEATYFVTFRLSDSLPEHALEELRLLTQSKMTPLAQARRSFATLERYMDAGSGSAILNHKAAAQIVADAIRFHHTKRYRLIAWCVMPNHVHVCLKMLAGHELCDSVHSWKSFSAKKINTLFHLTGRLWMREYYDRLLRDGDELARTVRYISNNPAKAGLRDLPWVEVLSEC